MKPPVFEISTTDDCLISHSGLAFIGQLLHQGELPSALDDIILADKPNPETPHADVILAMIALLSLGKSDFDDIDPFRKDTFFQKTMGLSKVPSAPTLRQRMNELGVRPLMHLLEASAAMVRSHAPALCPCWKDYIPLDVDVSPFDNSNTKKEGVFCTYKMMDGYAPIFAYLGAEGYTIHLELREGNQHCQDGTPAFLREALRLSRRVTNSKLLVRMDAGNDAQENLELIRAFEKADFIIKRNLRKESVDEWMEEALCFGELHEPRAGKEVYLGDTIRQSGGRPWRVVFKVTKQTVTPEGQLLLVPEIQVETYWTSLGPRTASPEDVIALYRDHGTSEQFHSEFKTDLDLERLPSGRFATNALVLTCGAVAYNALRLIGQKALSEDHDLPPQERMPIRKSVKRRRVRSVIQDFMYLASRFTRHARSWGLALSRANPWRPIWQQLYAAMRVPILALGEP